MSNPLFDTLFRPTTASPLVASAAPVRQQGTHTRAGNAMNRTRAALLAGAARAVAVSGTKITMAQVAAAAGVAKATLYNHFRTREAVLAALVGHQVQAIIDEQTGKPLGSALVDAATAIGSHPVRRGLARVEPAVLAAIGRVDRRAAGWQQAYAAVDAALRADSRDGAETVLRWLASFLLTEAAPEAIARDVAVLLAGLPVCQD
ncbi:MAG TPA: TetR family transcriptional regulator [Gaiellales bacterium]|nr:TetR family transcriptional regulator [Gaiellales bacterium]